MMSKSERDIADRYLIIRKYGKKTTVSMNDKAIDKETRYYGYFVLVSNNSMDTFSALREYQLRERTKEGFRIDRQFNDSHVTRAKSTASLDGRFFCQFIAFGYEEYLRNAINRGKKTLAVKNGDPEHDSPKALKKEKALLIWLNKMSISKLLDWYDAVQETTVKTKFGRTGWKTESVERDRLFLQKLGVIKS